MPLDAVRAVGEPGRAVALGGFDVASPEPPDGAVPGPALSMVMMMASGTPARFNEIKPSALRSKFQRTACSIAAIVTGSVSLPATIRMTSALVSGAGPF